MTVLTIQSPLADDLQTLAEQEQRSIDDLLAEMLHTYRAQHQPPDFEAFRGVAGFIVPSGSAPPSPLTEAERAALGERLAAGGPLSDDVIAQRKQGA